jgi:adenylate cyclase
MYGPQGHIVNPGSRVQGATKYLKCRLLITADTATKLKDTFIRRRLCQARLVNIREPIRLYELAPPDQPGWIESVKEYELALAEFEQKQFHECTHRLANLRARQPDDGPTLVLLSRAVNCMVEEPEPFDPVWVLPCK